MKPVYTDLALRAGAHTGGLCSVKIAPKEWLAADPVIDFNTGTIVQEIQLISGKSFLNFSFTEESYDYSEKQKVSKAGLFYEITLSGLLNHINAAMQQTIETLRYHELVAIVTDRKKRKKFVGSMDAGLHFQLNSKHTNAQGGIQSGAIDLVMESEFLPPFYTYDSAPSTMTGNYLLVYDPDAYLLINNSGDYLLVS